MEVSAGFLPLNIPTDSWIPFGIWVELEPPGVFPRWSWCRHQKSALEKLWRKVGKQLNGLCVTELWELTGRINWLEDKAWDPVCFRLYFAPLPFCSVLLLSFFLLCFVLFCFVGVGVVLTNQPSRMKWERQRESRRSAMLSRSLHRHSFKTFLKTTKTTISERAYCLQLIRIMPWYATIAEILKDRGFELWMRSQVWLTWSCPTSPLHALPKLFCQILQWFVIVWYSVYSGFHVQTAEEVI